MATVESYKRYKAVYKNYLSVMFNIYRKKDNIKVILKNGEIYYWNHSVASIYSSCNLLKLKNLKDYFNNKVDYFEFKYNDKYVRLYGMKEGNGDIPGVFVNNDYRFLNPENEIVLDIGANIGDSSIYFALANAKRVIALEPYPYSYNFALKNVNINNMNNKIMLLNAGYGFDSEIKVDENKVTNADSSLIMSEKGKSIKLFSLKSLISNYNLNDGLLLKMDCEGCEYNLLEEENDALKKFKRMQIEYHYGYEKLIEKLDECGFNVKYTKPKKGYNKDATDPHMYLGWIYAEKP
jgi:FkbM family methyltransferase